MLIIVIIVISTSENCIGGSQNTMLSVGGGAERNNYNNDTDIPALLRAIDTRVVDDLQELGSADRTVLRRLAQPGLHIFTEFTVASLPQ